MNNKRNIVRNVLICSIPILTVVNVLLSLPRVRDILEGGIYANQSFSMRWFRINACIKGFASRPWEGLFGVGIGNISQVLYRGFDAAFEEYKNDWTAEIEYLRNAKQISELYCLPMRIVVEFGAVLLMAGLIFLVYKCWKMRIDYFVILMTLWLYVQFDSYAFYSMWMVLYLLERYDKSSMGISYFERMKHWHN